MFWHEAKVRRRAEKIAAVKTKLAQRLEERSVKAAPPDPPPRYDDVFHRGVAWLDSLAEGSDGSEESLDPIGQGK